MLCTYDGSIVLSPSQPDDIQIDASTFSLRGARGLVSPHTSLASSSDCGDDREETDPKWGGQTGYVASEESEGNYGDIIANSLIDKLDESFGPTV